MNPIKRIMRQRRWSGTKDPKQLPGDDFVAILLLSVEPSVTALVLPHFSSAQSRRLTAIMKRMSFPDSLGILVLGQFLGVEVDEKSEDILAHLVAALEGFIRTCPQKAARSIEVHLPDWRPGGPGAEKSSKKLVVNPLIRKMFSVERKP